MTPGVAFLIAGAGLLTAVFTGLVRHYSLVHGVLDVPNARSSHVRSTPRGGGLAICVAALGAIAVAAALGWMPGPVAMALVGGGAVVAAVGFIDDHGGVPPRTRLIFHFLSALWALWWLGGYPRAGFGLFAVPIGL